MKTTEINKGQKFWHNGVLYHATTDGYMHWNIASEYPKWVYVPVVDKQGAESTLELSSGGYVQPANRDPSWPR